MLSPQIKGKNAATKIIFITSVCEICWNLFQIVKIVFDIKISRYNGQYKKTEAGQFMIISIDTT